jgi:hypothetical protein
MFYIITLIAWLMCEPFSGGCLLGLWLLYAFCES